MGAISVYRWKVTTRSNLKPLIVKFLCTYTNNFQGFLAPGELDPLNRRLCSEKKPDVVVQVVILAEDDNIRNKLAEHDIMVQTIADVAPIEVQPARVLSHLYTYLGMMKLLYLQELVNIVFLGRNKKLGLSGRKSRDVGILSTSKLYAMGDKIFAFTPQVSTTLFLPLSLSLSLSYFMCLIFFALVYRHVTQLYSVRLRTDDRYMQE